MRRYHAGNGQTIQERPTRQPRSVRAPTALATPRPRPIIRLTLCTLALLFQQSAEYPLVVAANRDELLARPSAGPAKVLDNPWVVAGLDLVAGGTWLGLNEHGLVAGLLNRRTSKPVDPLRRSRGSLCLEMLQQTSPEEAVEALRKWDGNAYNPFRLLLASPAAAYVGQNRGPTIQVQRLPPGVHVLTNRDADEGTCPSWARYRAVFREAVPLLEKGAIDPVLEHLQRALADHTAPAELTGEDLPVGLCVHLGNYGTRSSTILFYAARQSRWRFFHAEGPPCSAPYSEIPLPAPQA